MRALGIFRGGPSIAALLVAAALALGACGGDDEGDTVGATQPTAETTTGETTTGTTRERTETGEDRTTTREKGDDRGRNRNRGRGGGGSGSDGRSGGGSDDSRGGSQPPAQPGNVRRVAQTVCSNFLPTQIERDLKQNDREPEDVARDYARGFPERQREAAYEGCLAGLRKK